MEENKDILGIIKGFMRVHGIRPYDETTHKGLVRHALIRKGFHSGEIMVCLVINGKDIPAKEQLVEELCQVKGMTSISYSINQEKTNELKEVVQQFVNTYQINITDDEKADPQEVANVLKVIEMCGTGLTAEVLRTALEPIKGSRSTLKMIETMFRSKNDRALALEASYNPECIDLLDDYIGRTGAIIGYEDTFAEVKSALNVPLLVSAGLHGEPDYNGSVINRLSDTTPYITLCLSDSMMKVGKLYEQVSLEYPGFFK